MQLPLQQHRLRRLLRPRRSSANCRARLKDAVPDATFADALEHALNNLFAAEAEPRIHQGKVLNCVFRRAVEDPLATIEDALNELRNWTASVDDSGERKTAIHECPAVHSHVL